MLALVTRLSGTWIESQIKVARRRGPKESLLMQSHNIHYTKGQRTNRSVE